MKKEKKSDAPVFVLVGPMIESFDLARWAHRFFMQDDAVVFVGVDSGVKPLIQSGLPVSFAVGDWDSLDNPKKWLDGLSHVTLKSDKDGSDLHYAIEACREFGARSFVCMGFQGGEADQELGVHLDLSDAASTADSITSIGPRGRYDYFSRPNQDHVILGSSGQKVSIFPLFGEAKGVKFRGLRYLPRGGILKVSSHGLSNVLTQSQATVRFSKGRLIVMQTGNVDGRKHVRKQKR